MDPKKLFYDERNMNVCIYCGGVAETKDHLPSKIFLRKPYPTNLHAVGACFKCNNGFSVNEEYMACFLHCVMCGSTNPTELIDERIAKSLERNTKLREKIENSHEYIGGIMHWNPEIKRIEEVVSKIAKGHIYYELSEIVREEPVEFHIIPLNQFDEKGYFDFMKFDCGGVSVWPEIGSRAFLRLTGELNDYNLEDRWVNIQKNIYRYSVEYYPVLQVKMIFSDYLHCHLIWE
ncbi:hypothetical protein [Pantoea ananatis]|uniref:hypothetical protein n=2 Tax=Pantoea TaxID=53335 RepID=UPI001B30E96A|nr:hypothetical protein [Pantoea ananatis]